ncbi:MAG: type II toxin-antitoxin system ParD family antitoxin [Cyanobacteria bacterium]|nr:type II toxin-antitoxin system ParD family antitoxin [Cyanobacteriota bacterium]
MRTRRRSQTCEPASASEVVREALRLMEQQDQLRVLQLQQLRRDIQDGLANGEA